MLFNKVCIVGMGLIGGSIALDLQKRKLCETVVGVVRRRESIAECQALGIGNSVTIDIEQACTNADLIIIATPISTMIPIVDTIKSIVKPTAIIIDVASVKGEFAFTLEKTIGQSALYVATHPMAGSEKRGPAFAHANLFENAVTIITPTEKTQILQVNMISDFWEQLGARIIILDPDTHDKLVAMVSHVPHVISWSLMHLLCSDVRATSCIGSGFKDMTRIAASDPMLWKQICMWNRNHILEILDLFKSKIDAMYACIKESQWDSLENSIIECKKVREGIADE